VLDKMNHLPGILRGAVRYNVATVLTLAGYRPKPFTVTVDDGEARSGRAMLLVIGNGRYFGGGMHVAPEARIDDGELDLIALQARPMPQLLANFPKLYAGTHLSLPMVEHGRARRIVIDGDVRQLLEIDGEQPGTTPAAFEILPGALNVLVPALDRAGQPEAL
jgi:diacylglycerol kinase family enzyme